jgi:hypothetical protein
MATLNSLTINDTSNLNLPTGTSGTRTSLTATVSSFTTVGTTSWTAPTGVNLIEVLVVAGGGGGGGWGGGGGAGGLIYRSSYPVVPGTSYIVTVGGGGAAGTTAYSPGGNGGNSRFDNLVAIGGGGGGHWANTVAPSGGSGGGATGWSSADTDNAQFGLGTPGQGHNGGIGGGYDGSGYYKGHGGGGGAGGPGANYFDDGEVYIGGEGGPGLPFNISGTTVYYAGGGGGHTPGANTTESRYAKGGIGGGGDGGNYYFPRNATDGAPNTGGGGGAAYGAGDATRASAAGGSGIVIIRHATFESTLEPTGLTRFNTQDRKLETVNRGTWKTSTRDVLDDALLQHWDAGAFVSGSSTIRDLTGNGYDLTLVNSPTWVADNGGYFQFNGTTQRLSFTAFPAQTDRAVSAFAWVFYNGYVVSPPTSDSNGIFGVGGASGGNTHFEHNTANSMRLRLGTSNNSAMPRLPLNRWAHVGFTTSGQITKFYINGEEIIQTMALTGAIFGGTWGAWGQSEFGNTRPFNGRIASGRVYSTNLTAADVTRLYNLDRDRFDKESKLYNKPIVKEGLILNLEADKHEASTSTARPWVDSENGYVFTSAPSGGYGEGRSRKEGPHRILASPGFHAKWRAQRVDQRFTFEQRQFTLDFWVNFTTTNYGVWQYLFGRSDFWSSGTYGLYINSNGTALGFHTTGTNGLELALSTIGTGWKHIVAVRGNGERGRGIGRMLYVNGQMLAQDNVLDNCSASTHLVSLGCDNEAEYSNAAFQFGDAKIYEVALSSEQVARNFEALRGYYGV